MVSDAGREVERLTREKEELLAACRESLAVIMTRKDPGYDDLTWLNRLVALAERLESVLARSEQGL